MKKYIYTLILFAFSASLKGQRVSETLVPLTTSKEIKDAAAKVSVTTTVFKRTSCCFVRGCYSSMSESTKSGPGTGLEGHNFIEKPAIIYPNPVKDVINIKSTDPITVIEILNIHGQVDKNLDSRTDLLDVSDLPAGVYYVRIHFENKKTVQVEKILVVK